MSRKPIAGSLIAAAVLLGMQGFARAQTAPPTPAPAPNPSDITVAPGGSAIVYNMAPATARAAYAEEEYDRASVALTRAIQDARSEFHRSADYRQSKQAVLQAAQRLELARIAALANLNDDPNYKRVLAQRTEVQVELDQPNLPPGLRAHLAMQKLGYAATASQMQEAVLARDGTYQSARNDLAAAQQALQDRVDAFESGLANQPAVAAAQHAFDSAKSERAGAEGYLAGAEQTRQDALAVSEPAEPIGYDSLGGIYDPFGYGGLVGYGYPGFGYGYGGFGYGSGGSSFGHHGSLGFNRFGINSTSGLPIYTTSGFNGFNGTSGLPTYTTLGLTSGSHFSGLGYGFSSGVGSGHGH